MKQLFTLCCLLVFLTGHAQTSVTPVNCTYGKYYVRVTFSDIVNPLHPVSTVNCADGLHENTEQSQFLSCKMELFADPACIQAVPVDPRFFAYDNIDPVSHGTRVSPAFLYLYNCAASFPGDVEHQGNWRRDLYLVTRETCSWNCSAGAYSCVTAGPGVPNNYNILINCCFGPGVLDVHLTGFSGVRTDGKNSLTWVLENRQDLVRLEVERSTDGVQYKVVYTTTDATVTGYSELLEQSAYYRLRIYNSNQTNFTSSIILLKAIPENEPEWLIGPSPFREVLNIGTQSRSPFPAVFRLVSMDGKTVFRSTKAIRRGSNQFVFYIPVPAGIYLLQIETNTGLVSRKLLKQ